MIYIEKDDRVLLRDGRSVMSPWNKAKEILEGTDSPSKSLCSRDSAIFEELTGQNISSDIEDVHMESSHEQSTEDLNELIRVLGNCSRFSSDEMFLDRIEKELDFFWRTGNIGFVSKTYELINRFKEDGVVWGVGRGSGCSSLVLYVLEVHDVDPLLYDIGFHELSKEF